MSENEKPVPYIKRLENQRDALIAALKAFETHEEAVEKSLNSSYKADAVKTAVKMKVIRDNVVSEAKKLLGGLYA